MGRYKTHAKDGTLRCPEPSQDADGNWYCPSCFRASGFKSKHSVLGHLRFCRPGKPALDELLEPITKAPPASAIASGAIGRVHLPSSGQVAAVGLSAGPDAAFQAQLLARMSALEGVVVRSVTNHASHSGLKVAEMNAAAKEPPKGGATSGFSWGKFAAVAGGAVAAAVLLRDRDEPKQVVKRDPRLDRLCKRFAEKGEELPDECREPSAPLAGVPQSRTGAKAGGGSTLGRLAENGAKTLFENLFANVGKQAAKQIAG